MPQVGGGTIDLANLRGKPVWVNFMGTYCPPCVDEFPLMNGFAARYADDGLVDPGDRRQGGGGRRRRVRREPRGDLPARPRRRRVGRRIAGTPLALPVHFWIDKDGIIRDGALGGIGPDIMARGLQTIMPGVDVTP